MEEKERFGCKYNEKLMKHYTFDNENKEELGYKGVVRVLNQQDARIADIEEQLKKSQNQKAIEELEKLKDFFLEPYKDEEMDTEFLITKDAGEIADYILDQIKQLKEMQ